MTGDDLRYLLWPANPLLPAEFTFDEAGLRQTPATAYELILRAHVARQQARIWQLPDDPLDPRAWLFDLVIELPLPIYAGPTVLDYRRRPTLRRWPANYWQPTSSSSWVRIATRYTLATGTQIVYYRGGRMHARAGGRRPDWVDAMHRAIAEQAARRHKLLAEPGAARTYAAEFGTSTLTDAEHWIVAEQVDELLQAEQWTTQQAWVDDWSTHWLINQPTPYYRGVL